MKHGSLSMSLGSLSYFVCMLFFLGYRHVYLEGMEAASIFVHVSVHDITGKVGSKGSDDGISPTRPF